MNVMLRTVDKAADAPTPGRADLATLAQFAHDLSFDTIPQRCASAPSI